MKQSERVLDDVERGIVRLLQEDGRMSTTELSRRLSASEPTVRKKLNRILDEGIVRVRAVAHPGSLGYTTTAYIGLVVERSKLEQVANKLAEYDLVDSVVVSTGPNDITIKLCAESVPDVYDFLFSELANVDGIRDTDTTFVFREVKCSGLKGVVGVSLDQAGTVEIAPAK